MIAESAITAGLVGAIMGLIRLVEYLVKRNQEPVKQASPYNGNCPREHSLEKVIDRLDSVADKLVVVADRLERTS